jgi:phosphoglycerate dehydrogenase-like enzyme
MPASSHLRVLPVMDSGLFTRLFPPSALQRLRAVAELDQERTAADFASGADIQFLAAAEVLLTCWGAPSLNASLLAAAPNLRAVVHAAGSVKEIVTEESWARGIEVSSAAWANARPVAEYTLAVILGGNKRMLECRDLYGTVRSSWDRAQIPEDAGNQSRTIGIVGASHVGRRVIELLGPFDFELLVSDPYLTSTEASALGARLVELDELCSVSDVVTLHAPALPETRQMIDARRLALLRDGATLINTARGSLVDTDALAEALTARHLYAVIYDLPNVLLTPHIAGAAGNELPLLGEAAVDELLRYASGQPFAHPVLRADLDRTA